MSAAASQTVHRAGAGGNYDSAEEMQNGRAVIPSER
jgi:hypothetical protein